jgi:hypothetical protein
VEACAFWLVFCLIRDLKPALIAHDEVAKTAGQCLVARLQAFLTVAAGEQRFSALCTVTDGLIAKLVDVWSTEAEALPYYPAFRQREQANGQTARSAT